MLFGFPIFALLALGAARVRRKQAATPIAFAAAGWLLLALLTRGDFVAFVSRL